ncbi:hypothetical protein AB834_02940 [PVC group bacterium (ex Bugula neritina AB1)]|nr:hypothetical protein AB834_02940 [PVC group bacterium (ex Bugula neritina AB1)]
MFIFGYFVLALSKVVGMVLNFFYIVLIIRIVLSWLNIGPYQHEVIAFVYKLTDPILAKVRRLVPLQIGPVDLSAIIVFLAIAFLDVFLVNVLVRIAQGMLS